MTDRQLTVAANNAVYMHPPACEEDPYNCDCGDCREERSLDRARRNGYESL